MRELFDQRKRRNMQRHLTIKDFLMNKCVPQQKRFTEQLLVSKKVPKKTLRSKISTML